MPDDPYGLVNDIVLLERAIEQSAESLASGQLSAAESQVIREGVARLKQDIAALRRRLEQLR